MDTQQFDASTADDMVFDNQKTSVTIAGREIEIKPLNLAGIKTVLNFIRGTLNPIYAAYMQYRADQEAYVKQKIDNNDPDLPPPNPLWWFGLIEERVDDLYLLVTHVLQRGDNSITLQWVQEHLNPLVDLQELFPIIIRINHLDKLVKNALTNQTVKNGIATATVGAFQTVTTSETSQSTSVGTTDSTSSESLEPTATSPSPNA